MTQAGENCVRQTKGQRCAIRPVKRKLHRSCWKKCFNDKIRLVSIVHLGSPHMLTCSKHIEHVTRPHFLLRHTAEVEVFPICESASSPSVVTQYHGVWTGFDPMFRVPILLFCSWFSSSTVVLKSFSKWNKLRSVLMFTPY